MGNVGFWEIFILAVLALLIFGPERLPQMARSAGRTIAALKREAAGTIDELKQAADLDDFEDVKQVGRELRSARSELSKTALLAGPVASAAAPTKPRNAAMATVTAAEAPPFDPDAP